MVDLLGSQESVWSSVVEYLAVQQEQQVRLQQCTFNIAPPSMQTLISLLLLLLLLLLLCDLKLSSQS